MTGGSDFKFDVAFSLLARDLGIAKDLADRLEPGLRTFVYERQKEELLGGDGMERFARLFGHETRLAVIRRCARPTTRCSRSTRRLWRLATTPTRSRG